MIRFSSLVCLFSMLLINPVNVRAQTNMLATGGGYGWAKSLTGTKDDLCTGVAADSRNGVYAYGYFKSDTLYFGGQYLVGTGGQDIFLVKYDTLGNLTWAKKFGNGLINTPASITTDINSQLVITGKFSGTISFDGNSLTATGGTDAYIVRIRPTGEVVWARKTGGNQHDDCTAVNCDNTCAIYIGGSYSSSDFSAGSTSLPLINTYNVWYCKLDSSGNFQWAKSAGSAGTVFINDINILKSGRILIGGPFGGTINFNPLGFTPLSTGYQNSFILKTDPAGNFISQSRTGSSDRYFAGGFTVLPNQRIAQSGYVTFLSFSAPASAIVRMDSLCNILNTTYSSGQNSSSSAQSGDVIADNQNRVVVLTGSYNSENFLGNYTVPNNGTTALWEFDSAMTTTSVLWNTSATGAMSGSFSCVAKDTVSGALFVAGAINSNTAGGSYTIGSNSIPHLTVNDGIIFQVKQAIAPPPLIAFAGNDTTVCAGQSITIGNPAGATGGQAPYTYSWSPTTGLASSTSPSTTLVPFVTKSYVLLVQDSYGLTVRDTVNITVQQPPPAPTITPGGSTTFCSGGSLLLTSSAGSSYIWSNGSTTQSINATISGPYTVKITNSAGCQSAASVPVTINATPNTWTGAVSTAWEDPANWSCGAIPNASTVVVINSGTVVINSSAICYSLTLQPGVNLVINSIGSLTVLH